MLGGFFKQRNGFSKRKFVYCSINKENKKGSYERNRKH